MSPNVGGYLPPGYGFQFDPRPHWQFVADHHGHPAFTHFKTHAMNGRSVGHVNRNRNAIAVPSMAASVGKVCWGSVGGNIGLHRKRLLLVIIGAERLLFSAISRSEGRNTATRTVSSPRFEEK